MFTDLRKAFDSLDRNILLRKLELYGVPGILLKWFASYLSNRKQYTQLNGVKSNIMCNNYGVLQDSVLGPLLFLIYINDLPNVDTDASMKLSADDTNVFNSDSNLLGLCNETNACLSKIGSWLYANRLTINVDKSAYMLFTKNDPSLLRSPIVQPCINGQNLEFRMPNILVLLLTMCFLGSSY